MMGEIRNNQAYTVSANTKIGKLELLLLFFRDKYAVLIRVCDLCTQQVLATKAQLQLVIQFLCLSYYVCRAKKTIRNLKYKRVKVNDGDKADLIEEDNQDYDLLLDKYKNFFEQKHTFHSNQLDTAILPKLLEIKDKKDPIAAQLPEIF